MSIVKFGDVVREIKNNVDRNNNPYDFFVAGDHMDTEELYIKRRGTFKGSDVGPAFTRIFKPGQVLYGSRRTYLKKVAMADFEGITANTTFIIESKDENKLLTRLLPFIMYSDRFTHYSISKSKGSTNPYILFKDLATYEFNLPPLEEQKKLTETLWQLVATMESYKKLLAKTDEMVKAKFVEMFGDFYRNDKNWPIKDFGEFATIDANMTKDYEKYANYPHIGIDSIEKETGKLSGFRTVKEDNVISPKYVFTNKHIIYSKIRPNLNKVALPDFEGLCSADAYPILPNYNVCNRLFLAITMRSSFFLDYILKFSNRSNMPKVNREQISGFKMPLPPLELQNKYEIFVQKAEESKAAIQASLDSLKQVYKKIITDNLN